jgi:hypothetical protein
MITNEEAKVSVEEIESIEDVKSCLEIYSNAKLWENIKKYITQQEELTTAVKRLFELEELGTATTNNIIEYGKIRNKINEMVGIK